MTSEKEFMAKVIAGIERYKRLSPEERERERREHEADISALVEDLKKEPELLAAHARIQEMLKERGIK